MTTSFGIEEEFVLVDRTTLEPMDVGGLAVAELSDAFPGTVTPEFSTSQIEYASAVCTTTEEALAELAAFRSRLVSWADEAGVVAAASGTPFCARADAPVSPSERYGRIATDIAGLAGDHQINGLHVHVEIPDRDAGIRASNALRPWLPVLLAISANSPYWHGEDTGFDSWRAIHGRRWTTSGIPPWFPDAQAYDAATASLTGIGAISDPGTINWAARLSDAHPTVEVRVCDAQLDPRASVALAVIIRALAESGMARPLQQPRPFDEVTWDAALWHAARYGVGNALIHPHTRSLASAETVLSALTAEVAPHLARPDADLIDGLIHRVLREGNGATIQRAAAYRGGREGLRDLYRERPTSLGPCQRSSPSRRATPTFAA